MSFPGYPGYKPCRGLTGREHAPATSPRERNRQETGVCVVVPVSFAVVVTSHKHKGVRTADLISPVPSIRLPLFQCFLQPSYIASTGQCFGAFHFGRGKCWVSSFPDLLCSLLRAVSAMAALSAPSATATSCLFNPVPQVELMRHSYLNNPVRLKLQIFAPQQLCVVTEINILTGLAIP